MVVVGEAGECVQTETMRLIAVATHLLILQTKFVGVAPGTRTDTALVST
jgi:hypothetical protein